MRSFFLLVPLLILTTIGCTIRNAQNEKVPQTLETEKQAVIKEGVVIPKEITFFENGTHYLVADSGERFLLKSHVIDLSRYEEQPVRVTGEMEINPEPESLPVITVYTLDSKQPDAEQRKSVFTEASLGYTMSLPGNWQRHVTDDGVHEYFPEDSDPVITAESVLASTQEGIQAKEEMLTATAVLVDGKSAKRTLDNDGGVNIYVSSSANRQILIFRFIPSKDYEITKATFYEMLSSLTWITQTEEEELAKQTTGPGSIVCGGSAKKLCPTGFRCELESFEVNAVGVCVDASLAPDDISRVLEKRKTDSILEPEEPAESVKTDKVPESWTTYERERFEYSFAIPSSWWWSEIADENSLSTIVIAQEKVTDDNVIVRLKIEPGSIASKKEGRYAKSIELSLPRDDDSHFVLSGDIEFSEQIRGIANSLSSF